MAGHDAAQTDLSKLQMVLVLTFSEDMLRFDTMPDSVAPRPRLRGLATNRHAECEMMLAGGGGGWGGGGGGGGG